MLDSHPHLAIPPETHFIRRAAKACKRASNPHRAFLETVTSTHRWEHFGIERDSLVQEIIAIEPFDISEALRSFYALWAKRFGKPRWGDKTPTYLRRMTFIHNLLPEAHYVHIIRDGRDVALSIKDLWFGANSVDEAAYRWQADIEKARSQSRELPHYLEIRYEDLVSDTESTLRKVCDFIDILWDASMLDYYKTAEERMSETWEHSFNRERRMDERKKALHSLTREPPQRDRVSRWRQEMSTTDRQRFEEVAGETLRGLGYDVG